MTLGNISMLVIGADGPGRDRLILALGGVFKPLRVFEVSNAREALILLDEMHIDCVLALRSEDDGEWSSFIRRWMSTKPGLRDIPFFVAADTDDLHALRRALDEQLIG